MIVADKSMQQAGDSIHNRTLQAFVSVLGPRADEVTLAKIDKKEPPCQHQTTHNNVMHMPPIPLSTLRLEKSNFLPCRMCNHPFLAPAQAWCDEPWLYEGGLLDADELRAFDASPVPIIRSAHAHMARA